MKKKFEQRNIKSFNIYKCVKSYKDKIYSNYIDEEKTEEKTQR